MIWVLVGRAHTRGKASLSAIFAGMGSLKNDGVWRELQESLSGWCVWIVVGVCLSWRWPHKAHVGRPGCSIFAAPVSYRQPFKGWH